MHACYKIEWRQTAEVLSVLSTESHGPESLARVLVESLECECVKLKLRRSRRGGVSILI